MTQGTFLGEQKSDRRPRDDAAGVIVRGFTLAVLILNILAGALLPAGPAFARNALAGMEICTAAGMVVLDRDGNAVPSSGPSGHDELCVFCLPLLHAGSAPPALAAALVQPPPAAGPPAFPTVSTDIAPRAPPPGTASPRAPPAV